MLTRLANLGIRRPKRILAFAGLLIAIAALYGGQASSHLASGGFYDTRAASWQARNLLANTFDSGDPNLVLEVRSAAGADGAAARTAGLHIVADLRTQPYVTNVTSYWSAPPAAAPGLRSKDGTAALVVARVVGDDNTAPKRAKTIFAPLVGTHDGVTVKQGGIVGTISTVNHLTTSDLTRSEMIAVPLTVVALIWVFGSFVAALLPLAVGITSIIGTMAILRLLSTVTDVSVYSLNMTTAMGLALAIDYSLFAVSRYREEIRHGVEPDQAVRVTMRTAGRTVLFSAMTVGLSLAAMLVFPVYFLRSFAYAGIAVVAFATVATLLLPALLTLLGTRVDSLDLRVFVRRLLRRPPPVPKPVEATFWYRFARFVMRRALPIGLLVTALLVALGLPFLHAKFGYPDDHVVPKSEAVHQVGDDLRNNFATNAGSVITVVAPDTGRAPGALATYASTLSDLPGVSSVSASSGTYSGGQRVAQGDPAKTKGNASYLDVEIGADAQSDTAKHLLSAARTVPAPWPVQFTGQTAINADSLHALAVTMPIAIGLIVLASFVVLFLFTGSLVLPVKALVLNTLSLSATFGAMVWVFQQGHLGWLVGHPIVTGSLDTTMPILMFCVAFGLSMDYEVFLLSRIKETYDAGADNTAAVAVGLERTGRLVSAAAALIAVVWIAFVSSSVSFIKMLGLGMALAVIVDATLVRGVLVPAFMRLAGDWNWWSPQPLRRIHGRFGMHDGDQAPVPWPRSDDRAAERV